MLIDSLIVLTNKAIIEGIRAEVDLDPSTSVTVIARDMFNILPSNHRRMRVPDHMRELNVYVQFAARDPWDFVHYIWQFLIPNHLRKHNLHMSFYKYAFR